MRSRTHSIHFRRGQQFLAVRRELIDDRVVFIGSINGTPCVSSSTKEGAVRSLIRRKVFREFL